jgi:hypothetical protein
MIGKKVSFSVYNLQGMLIESRTISKPASMIRLMSATKAQGIFIVKLKTLD